jgi:hypothetical protein
MGDKWPERGHIRFTRATTVVDKKCTGKSLGLLGSSKKGGGPKNSLVEQHGELSPHDNVGYDQHCIASSILGKLNAAVRSAFQNHLGKPYLQRTFKFQCLYQEQVVARHWVHFFKLCSQRVLTGIPS